jgi:hypothetical protein
VFECDWRQDGSSGARLYIYVAGSRKVGPLFYVGCVGLLVFLFQLIDVVFMYELGKHLCFLQYEC